MNERKDRDPASGKSAPAVGKSVPRGQTASRDFAAPLGAVTSGRLRFVGGASNIAIRADPTMGDLYHARFGSNAPSVGVRGATVTVRYPRFPLFNWLYYRRERPAEIALNVQIPWRIEIPHGASRLTADLSDLKLGSFSLSGGASRLEITLPKPSGTVSVRVLGGASNVTILRPTGVAARVCVGGGSTSLIFDEERFGAVGGDVDLQTPGYNNATDYYDIDITGGANAVTIGTHQGSSDE